MDKIKSFGIFLLLTIIIYGGLQIVKVETALADIPPDAGCAAWNLCGHPWSINECVRCWCVGGDNWFCECHNTIDDRYYTVSDPYGYTCPIQ